MSEGHAKPPVPKRKRLCSERMLSRFREGGQAGHPRATLPQIEDLDHIETHLPPQCAGCGVRQAESKPEGAALWRQAFAVVFENTKPDAC